MFLWRLSRVPVVLHSHGSDTEVLYPKMWYISKLLFRLFLKSSNKIIVLSQSWKKFYSEEVGIPEEKIIVLENPVILPEKIEEEKASRTTVVYSGRIGRRKGAFDLIRAWGETSAKIRKNLDF